jgi:hypothetical protein
MQAGLHRAVGHAQHLADSAHIEPEVVVEDRDLALTPWKSAERSCDVDELVSIRHSARLTWASRPGIVLGPKRSPDAARTVERDP